MNKKIYSFIAILALVFISLKSFAQDDLTIYSLNSIPQGYYNNPGIMPVQKFHIGCMPILFIPILSSNYTSVSNSGFKWDNFVRYDKAKDSIKLDPYKTIDKLSKKNYLIFNQQIEWLSFGFKIKHTQYINFSFTEKFNFRFTYPRDLLKLINGNSQFIGSEANFDHIGPDFIHYREIALGYTNQINNKLTVGGRAKLLFGLSNIWTQSINATLAVDGEYFDLTPSTNVVVHTSVPEKLYDSTGNNKFEGSDVTDYILNFNNPGFGIDLGASYKINNKWSVSASMLDFGYIFWKTGTRKFTSIEKGYSFSGFDVTPLIPNDSVTFEDVVKKVTDSLGKLFKVEQQNKTYSTPLSTKIYLSGCYNISRKDRALAVFRADFYEGTIHPAFSLSYNRTFGNILDVALSYSYANKDWLNIGFGSSVRFGPFQIFLVTDNLLAPIIPYHTKNVNVHFGCNYVFYYKPSNPLMKL
jgi:hypothetical protein